MAKKKNHRKKPQPAALRAYWAKKRGKSKSRKHHHSGGTTVAKKTKKRKHHSKHTKKRHHRGGGGGILGGLPVTEIVAGAAVGFIERESKADPTFILNKLPAPIDQLGRTGNTVLIAWLATKFGIVPSSMRHYVNQGVKVGAGIVAYQLMRQGAAFTKGDQTFTISGPAPEHVHGKHGRHRDVMDEIDDDDEDDEYIAGDDDIGDVDDEVSGWHADVNVTHSDDAQHDHDPAPVNG